MPNPKAKWQGQIRHLMTLAGGILVALGYLDQSDVNTAVDMFEKIAGPAALVIAHLWSWLAPEKQA